VHTLQRQCIMKMILNVSHDSTYVSVVCDSGFGYM